MNTSQDSTIVTWHDAGIVDTYLAHRAIMPYMRDLFAFALTYIEAMLDDAPPRTIVDLGCGSGKTGGALLQRYPEARLVMVDYSPAMLEQARATHGGDGRVRLVEADLQTTEISAIVDGPVDLVVSSFALHHLTHARQRAIYAEVFEALRSGGVFVNIEHIEPGSGKLEAIYWRWFYGEVAQRRNAAGESTTTAQVQAEFEKRREVDVLSPVATLCQWLREIGFEHVDCFFKAAHVSCFGGRRPA